MTEGLQPHRGVLILVLGIFSLFMCQILGVVAWIMGNKDLQAMDRREMDPEGRGMTQAGKILGIIAIVLAVLGIAFFVFAMVTGLIIFGAAAGAAGAGR